MLDPELEISFAEPEERYHVGMKAVNEAKNYSLTSLGGRSVSKVNGFQIHTQAEQKKLFIRKEQEITKETPSSKTYNSAKENVHSNQSYPKKPSNIKDTALLLKNKANEHSIRFHDKQHHIHKLHVKDLEKISSNRVKQSCPSKSALQGPTSKFHSAGCPRNPKNLTRAHENHTGSKFSGNGERSAISKCSNQHVFSCSNRANHANNHELKLVTGDITFQDGLRHSKTDSPHIRNKETTVLNTKLTNEAKLIRPEKEKTGSLFPKSCLNSTFNTAKNQETSSDIRITRCRWKPETQIRSSLKDNVLQPKTICSYPSLNNGKNCNSTVRRNNFKNLSSGTNNTTATVIKHRSESIHRYAVPPPNSRPVRSKSNLSELVRNKRNLQNTEKMITHNNRKESTEHIYDTIDTCGCHKKAIDRIDSVIRNSKSVVDLCAIEYDVPKNSTKYENRRLPFSYLAPKPEFNRVSNIEDFNKCSNCHNAATTEPLKLNDTSGVTRISNLIEAISNSANNDSDSSDVESTATYATIDDETIKPISTNNDTTVKTKDGKGSGDKLRTLDKKDDKRRTPDIVKCSREVIITEKKSKDNQSRLSTSFGSGSQSSFDKDSDPYYDPSPPSTVIHFPIDNRASHDKPIANKLTHDNSGSKHSLRHSYNQHKVDATDKMEEEIYSVVDDWPLTDSNFAQSYVNIPTQNKTDPNLDFGSQGSPELSDSGNSSGSYNKHSVESIRIGTLDPLKNHSPTNTDSLHSSSCSSLITEKASLVQCGQNASVCAQSPPNVTLCSSMTELCSLVKSDPNALVYVYKVNPPQFDGQTHSPQPPSVYILPR